MGSRTGSAIALILLVSCGGIERTETISAPTEASKPEPVVVASPSPKTIAPVGPDYECYVNNSGFNVVNNSAEIQRWQVYTTGFDEQHFPTSVIPASGVQHTMKPGDKWSDNPGFKCQQVDVTQEMTFISQPGGRPLCYNYFDKNGRTFHPGTNPEKATECRTPNPTPTPPVCNRNTSSVITYSEWGSCIMPPVGEACYQTRTKTITSECEQTKVLTETRYCHCPY